MYILTLQRLGENPWIVNVSGNQMVQWNGVIFNLNWDPVDQIAELRIEKVNFQFKFRAFDPDNQPQVEINEKKNSMHV